MSDSNFEERLRRISQGRPQAQAAVSAPKQRPYRPVPLVVGVSIAVAGVQLLRVANNDYEAFRAISPAAPIGAAALAVLLMVGGGAAAYRGLSGAGSHDRAARDRPPASAGSRLFLSLVGLCAGVVCILSFGLIVQVGGIAEPSDDVKMIGGFALILAFALPFLAVLFGVVGLILGRRVLHRVPGYFVLGAVVAFVLQRLWLIDPAQIVGLRQLLQ
jgi:hypothetical protein